MKSGFGRLILVTMLLAFVVIVLGAYVRLSDAGLGCPDWPGCYGILLGVPESTSDIAKANSEFSRAVEVGKAWKEMIHRYVAGMLGILVLIISFKLLKRDSSGNRRVLLGTSLAALLIFQALLGMWTVTLQLKPLFVVGHLIGGFTLFCLLGWQWLRSLSFSSLRNVHIPDQLTALSVLAIVVVSIQVVLGGWVSSNYAALACVDFPTCQQQWWPAMDFKSAFVLWRGLGVDYEFGVLDHPARVAIHVTHRIGALVTALVVLYYAARIWSQAYQSVSLRNISLVILFTLIAQIGLGVMNVVFHLPLTTAVLHNGVALLLLFSVVTSAYMLRYPHKINKSP